MKSYVALGFGNNFFYALGENALPIPSNLIDPDDDSANDESNSAETKPTVNLLPLHADAAPSSSSSSSSKTLQEYLQTIQSSSVYTTKSSPPIIACGTTHTTIILPSNNNSSPHLLGTIFGRVHPHPTPQPTRLPLKITRLSSGRRHVLALTEGSSQHNSGILLSWGAGHFGQLGHGPELTSSLEPRIVERLLPQSCGGKIVDIAAGGLHSLAIVAVDNGDYKSIGGGVVVRETRLFAWGSNRKSQCGVEGGKCATVPSPMPVVVVKREGRKSGSEERVDKVVHFEKVEAGRLHSIGLTAYGEVFTWGSTSMGRCGQSATSNPRGGDRRICQEPRYVAALKNVVIESIAAGDAHNLALSKNGRVFAWGAGVDGQCGQGHIGNLFTPKGIREIYFEDNVASGKKLDANVKVESEVAMEEEILSHDLGSTRSEKQIVRIRAAGCYSAALTSQGDLYTWGYGGGLAMGHPIPANQSDVPMLPLLEGNQYSYATSAKTYPEGCSEADNIRDCVSFDTELNVLMPRRVEVVKQLGMHVEDISLGPGHMVIVCSLPGSDDDVTEQNPIKANESPLEASDNNQTSDTDEVSSADLGHSDTPDTAEPPLHDSVNTEGGANTSMTSTAEAASNISHESVESTQTEPKLDKKRGFLAKMKSSRSTPSEASPPCAHKEKRKSFHKVGKLIDAALHRNGGK